MIVTISPSAIAGSLQAPPSKSCMQRACAAALINNGTTVIDNAGKSNDELAAINIVKKLGATVEASRKQVVITSNEYLFSSAYPGKHSVISVGESGLSLRMFAPLAALFKYEITLTGEGSILSRPVDFFEDVFPQLGVDVQTHDGKIPLFIQGPLKPRNITVDGSLSSQFLTGLLMAFAKACKTPVSIKVKNLTSRPYIDLTLDILAHFGFAIENDHYEKFNIFPRKKYSDHSVKYTVEGDWSNIAFLLVSAAIAGEITVKSAMINSTQGDKRIINALEACGAGLKITNHEVKVSKKNLNAFDFDATDSPDLFPPLVALASYCKGTSTIKGVNRLLHKESNRAKTLQSEFGKMNIAIELNNDLMLIKGSKNIKGSKVSSHNDHRIAMACAVAALQAKGNTVIHHAEAVKKSYPGFFDDIKKLKAAVQVS
ncbi:MAG TPA: 3-phosphoshikimate 1-carboxyvinyltransferase [Chitinophagaceae bacterium]|nr:3-phosphoshikimate 1-carboxyvinyltransferase [Chitinophagaceae bacterium]